MNNINKEYKMKIINKVKEETEPKRNIIFNMFKAFIVGGLICFIGEVIRLSLLNKFDLTLSNNITIIIMILISSILTMFGLYDKIGQFAGCGTIIPITGFANSMTSSTMETKSEGLIVGILNNVFKLAGSVIATAVLCGFILGLIRYLGGKIIG